MFKRVLEQASDRLLIDAGSADNLEHRGLRGNERANALREFLEGHLPQVFEVGSGEVIDFRDDRSGELDLFIFDRATAAALQASSQSALIPAEALYAVIEVKTTLTQDELDKSTAAAAKVRRLKPFKKVFVAARTGGTASNNRSRCPYFVFAYKTNLSKEDWASKEYNRICKSSSKLGAANDVIDRVVVLNRGIIIPKNKQSLLEEDSDGIFLEFYLHLVNFLTRERGRRPVIDWTAYTSRKKWKKIGKK